MKNINWVFTFKTQLLRSVEIVSWSWDILFHW